MVAFKKRDELILAIDRDFETAEAGELLPPSRGAGIINREAQSIARNGFALITDRIGGDAQREGGPIGRRAIDIDATIGVIQIVAMRIVGKAHPTRGIIELIFKGILAGISRIEGERARIKIDQ